MSFYWTTMENHGRQICIEDGGHYEALDRSGDTASVKISSDIIPSSDIPEVCVSGSPEASLFAKIQSAKRDGEYHIYKTDDNPDVKLSNSSLDFGILEEHRYNMNKRDSVNFNLFKTVNVPLKPIKDIKKAYKLAEKNQVNIRFANAIKSHLKALIHGQNYPSDSLKKAKKEEFEDWANTYDVETAKQVFDYVPEEYKNK